MNKHEVFAAVVMEGDGVRMKPQNIQTIKEGGVEYLRFRTILQTLEVQNRNRRTYTNNTVSTGLKADHVLELMRNRSFHGEAGHPLTQDTSRIMTVDPERASHSIRSTEVIGNTVYGEVETLADFNGPGVRFMHKILQGMEPAFSLRAMASLMKKGDGSSIANGRIHIVTYDQVILPSHKEAYRDKSTRIQKVNGIGMDLDCVSESLMIPVNESAVKDFIALESKNVSLVSNFYEVALESMELTPTLENVILREGGKTFYVKLEDKVKHEVRNFMAGL